MYGFTLFFRINFNSTGLEKNNFFVFYFSWSSNIYQYNNTTYSIMAVWLVFDGMSIIVGYLIPTLVFHMYIDL